MIQFRMWVDRYAPKHSFTLSISWTVSNFTIKVGNRTFNWWWPSSPNLYYNLNRVPWRRIILYCKARPYFCWLKGHDFSVYSGEDFDWSFFPRGNKCRWCDHVK